MMKTCNGCDRQLRPSGALAKDYPGTLKEAASGCCYTCYMKKSGKKRTPVYPRPCAGCDRLMRPNKSDPIKYPEAKAGHMGLGLCSRCYDETRRAEKMANDVNSDQDHQATVANLSSFMARIKGKSRTDPVVARTHVFTPRRPN